jgi:transposase-like protein
MARRGEFRERTVALVLEQEEQYSSQWEAICSVAAKVNVSSETLRKWVRQAEVDAGRARRGRNRRSTRRSMAPVAESNTPTRCVQVAHRRCTGGMRAGAADVGGIRRGTRERPRVVRELILQVEPGRLVAVLAHCGGPISRRGQVHPRRDRESARVVEDGPLVATCCPLVPAKIAAPPDH